MNTKYKFHNKLIVLITVLMVVEGVISCKKFVEVNAPYTSLNGDNVYTTDAAAISAVTGLYGNLGLVDGTIYNTISTITISAGLSADELTLYPGASTSRDLYRNDIVVSSAPNYWSSIYQQIIYVANSAIEGLNKSSSLTPSVKQQLLGEAKFMRAFGYFYLVNLYGNVPLVTTTDYKVNSLMARASTTTVWMQIITDLTEAKDLLNPNYVGADVITSSSTTNRVRPNKWTATALLARAYLYTGDYAKAEGQATEIISNTSLYSLSSLTNAFSKDPSTNKEAIWQIQPTTTGWNTNDARVFILPVSGPNTGTYPVYLSKRLVYSFEPGDNRVTNWISGMKTNVDSFYYAYKYKNAKLNNPVSEYNVVFRLAEQYLIRAEARAQQGSIGGAQSDLNTIRTRAGLPGTTAGTKDDLVAAILNERRHELFCEWGHRWFDLQRTNKLDAVMSIETPLKGGTWQSTDKYYPIPTSELSANPNLTQTPGY